MNRRSVITAAGFACIAFGEKPSRRNIQRRIAQLNGGKTFSSDEVAEFLRQPTPWSGPVAVQERSIPGPTPGPDIVLENGESGPVEQSTQDQVSTSHARRDMDIEGDTSKGDSGAKAPPSPPAAAPLFALPDPPSKPKREPTPMWALGEWLYQHTLDLGIRTSVRPEMAAKALADDVKADLRAAKTLLERYDREEVYRRAEALVDLRLRNKRRAVPTCRLLLSMWDDPELSPAALVAKSGLDTSGVRFNAAGAPIWDDDLPCYDRQLRGLA